MAATARMIEGGHQYVTDHHTGYVEDIQFDLGAHSGPWCLVCDMHWCKDCDSEAHFGALCPGRYPDDDIAA